MKQKRVQIHCESNTFPGKYMILVFGVIVLGTRRLRGLRNAPHPKHNYPTLALRRTCRRKERKLQKNGSNKKKKRNRKKGNAAPSSPSSLSSSMLTNYVNGKNGFRRIKK